MYNEISSLAQFMVPGTVFLGSTVIYSHLQATGLINDHLVSCFKYD